MPEYSSKEMVREKLLKSLKESGSGFDLSWYINNIISYTKVFKVFHKFILWNGLLKKYFLYFL